MSTNHSTTGNLAAKYRPEKLREVRGQPDAIAALRSFVAAPFSGAFLFCGPTGVGKTAAAWALAIELGCQVEHYELGGISEIPSGQQDGKAVEDLLRSLRLRPLFGSGWKVAIINEADRMTPQAETIWLDGLEHLPAKTVIIFTTNAPERLTDRLAGRCETVSFSGRSPAFRRGLRELVRKIWKAETGKTLEKVPSDLGRFEVFSGEFSIRLALQQIAPYVRTGKPLPASFDVPLMRDTVNGVSANGSVAAKKAWATRRLKAGRNGNGQEVHSG